MNRRVYYRGFVGLLGLLFAANVGNAFAVAQLAEPTDVGNGSGVGKDVGAGKSVNMDAGTKSRVDTAIYAGSDVGTDFGTISSVDTAIDAGVSVDTAATTGSSAGMGVATVKREASPWSLPDVFTAVSSLIPTGNGNASIGENEHVPNPNSNNNNNNNNNGGGVSDLPLDYGGFDDYSDSDFGFSNATDDDNSSDDVHEPAFVAVKPLVDKDLVVGEMSSVVDEDIAAADGTAADAATSTARRLPARTYNLTIGDDVDVDFPDFSARWIGDIFLAKSGLDAEGNRYRDQFPKPIAKINECWFHFCSNLRFNDGSNSSLVMTVTNASVANDGNYDIQDIQRGLSQKFILRVVDGNGFPVADAPTSDADAPISDVDATSDADATTSNADAPITDDYVIDVDENPVNPIEETAEPVEAQRVKESPFKDYPPVVTVGRPFTLDCLDSSLVPFLFSPPDANLSLAIFDNGPELFQIIVEDADDWTKPLGRVPNSLGLSCIPPALASRLLNDDDVEEGDDDDELNPASIADLLKKVVFVGFEFPPVHIRVSADSSAADSADSTADKKMNLPDDCGRTRVTCEADANPPISEWQLYRAPVDAIPAFKMAKANDDAPSVTMVPSECRVSVKNVSVASNRAVFAVGDLDGDLVACHAENRVGTAESEWIPLPKSGYVPVLIIVLVVIIVIIAVLVQRYFVKSNKARKRQERFDSGEEGRYSFVESRAAKEAAKEEEAAKGGASQLAKVEEEDIVGTNL